MKFCRVLDESDRELVDGLIAADPVQHCFLASRVEAGVLEGKAPGEVWGYPAHAPYALLHVGANLVTLGMDVRARHAFVTDLGRWRTFIAIVAPASDALALWRELGDRWGAMYQQARVVRERQLLMATAQRCEVDADPRLRAAVASDTEPYYLAAAAMYRDELEEDPLVTNPIGYRRHVQSLIASQRAFGIFEPDGTVAFKADIGAQGAGVAQVQGVWVRPDLRGRGFSVPAMAALTNHIVDSGRTASLYVNDFNTPAINCYLRCGYRIVGELASILY